MTAALEVHDLKKTYGGAGSSPTLNGITFSVEAGEVVCVVGPSGCGKTTLLRSLSGVLSPTSGSTRLGGRDISGPPEGMAVVFQDYRASLLPWLSNEGNVTLPLRSQGVSRAERKTRAAEALRSVGLDGAGDLYPWQLSGGMQQRVAIARALAYRPQVLLMDEPFASVDAQTRADLEDLVLKVQKELGLTVLLVTHDIDESVYLADRVVVLSHRPTVVDEIVSVGLSRPRDQVATKADPEFITLRAHVATLIRSNPSMKKVGEE